MPADCRWSQVDEDNEPARALYEGLGFVTVRERSEGSRMGFDRLLLARDLQAGW